MIFKSCLKKGIYPAEWEKADVVVPVYKKGIINAWKIRDRFLLFQCLVKYLKE